MAKRKAAWLVGAALCAYAAQAGAQEHLLKLREINFDMWCQETQHLPPARCDKRLPQDDAAYQAYANTIETYETQQLNREALDRRLDRTFRYDPIDNPRDPSAPPLGHPPQH